MLRDFWTSRSGARRARIAAVVVAGLAAAFAFGATSGSARADDGLVAPSAGAVDLSGSIDTGAQLNGLFSFGWGP
jgi:hypothetical protein